MRIVFFGSDDFAAVHLERLLKTSHQVVGCVTPPDKPQGRGMKITVSPVKVLADQFKINSIQPDSLKTDAVERALIAFDADIFVVVAYGKILPPAILAIPKKMCLNVHGSLLPRYRGAAPIQWAIIDGCPSTGVTVQKMAAELDAGDIIAQQSIAITATTTAGDLRLAMAPLGAKLLCQVIDDITHDSFTLISQDETHVTYAPKLTKDMGSIDWTKSASDIVHWVHGLQPWPGAFTFFKDRMVKIINAHEDAGFGKPGEIVSVDKNGISVGTGEGMVVLTSLQPQAGRVMSAWDFACGYRLRPKDYLRAL